MTHGSHPVIVFSPGFLMDDKSYKFIAEEYVSLGYVFAMVGR